jgi:hypothetical protein
MRSYIIRKSLAEEANAGWVWICEPRRHKAWTSRTVVKIRRPGSLLGVYVELRLIDTNFIKRYNEGRRLFISDGNDMIVMSEWYRHSLGVSATSPDNTTGTVRLDIQKAPIWGWRSLRAAVQQPDPVARLSTRLGILGLWLGLLGVWLGVLGILPFGACREPAFLFGGAILAIVGVLGVWGCWGRPKARSR